MGSYFCPGPKLHHLEVVGDEEIRQTELFLKFAHQVRHLGGDGDVEGGELGRLELDQGETLFAPPANLFRRQALVQGKGFFEELAHPHLGIEGGVQVLEDHLHLAPSLSHDGGRKLENLLAPGRRSRM